MKVLWINTFDDYKDGIRVFNALPFISLYSYDDKIVFAAGWLIFAVNVEIRL